MIRQGHIFLLCGKDLWGVEMCHPCALIMPGQLKKHRTTQNKIVNLVAPSVAFYIGNPMNQVGRAVGSGSLSIATRLSGQE